MKLVVISMISAFVFITGPTFAAELPPEVASLEKAS